MPTHKALHAYLWDDVPADLKAALPAFSQAPQMVWVVPERWEQRYRSVLPPALASLLHDYAGAIWGRVERFHEGFHGIKGTTLIVCFGTSPSHSRPPTGP